MSAANPPCVAELTFMRVLPMRLKEMTEAAIRLAESMDRLSAAVGKRNEHAPDSADEPDRSCRSDSPHADRAPNPPYPVTEEARNG